MPSNYRRQFETPAEFNGWTNLVKATALILVLRDKALEMYSTLPGNKRED